MSVCWKPILTVLSPPEIFWQLIDSVAEMSLIKLICHFVLQDSEEANMCSHQIKNKTAATFYLFLFLYVFRVTQVNGQSAEK